MKYLFSISLSLILLGCNNQNSNSGLEFTSQVIDLGEVLIDEEVRSKIFLKNKGNEKVEILKIDSDCSCTVLNFDKMTLEPFDSTFVEFTFKSSIPSYHQQKIAIETNSKKTPKILFLVRAKVVENS